MKSKLENTTPNRRQFLQTSALTSLATLLNISSGCTLTSLLNAEQEVDWAAVRSQFPVVEWEYTHFNSASAGQMPLPVEEHLITLIRQMNRIPPYEAWSIWQATKQQNLNRLANLLQVSSQELQIVRNTTEALNMVISGLPLKAGDQVLYSEHDYPFAKNSWQQRAKRDGIELIEVKHPLPASPEVIVAAYGKVMTPNVKIIHCTHITHATGHIMPVAAISELAHQQGAQSLVDGAHSLGQIEVDLTSINCDYFASSLHKWLNAPYGTGLIFAKEEHIPQLANYPSAYPSAYDSMNKYEQIGTRAFHQEIGVAAALDFHDTIGFSAKFARLQQLKKYWTEQLLDLKQFTFLSKLNPEEGAAITSFCVENEHQRELKKRLKEEYGLHTKSVRVNQKAGIRISVNIFTDYSELDRLVEAIRTIAES